jgi:hypothetical protein
MINKSEKGITQGVHTFLLSIATAGVLGCFGVLWNMNNAITRLQDHDTENINAREEQGGHINTIQLDIRDIRERMVKIESQKQPK